MFEEGNFNMKYMEIKIRKFINNLYICFFNI